MKIALYTSWLIVALMASGFRQAGGQTTKEPKAAPAVEDQFEDQFFQFNGGNLNQFLTKLRDQFGEEVYDLIEIRDANPDRIRVPKMRIQLSVSNEVRQVFSTYNQISKEGEDFLGKWIYSPPEILSHFFAGFAKPLETIIFLGPKASGADGTGGIQVRAFSVRGMSEDRLKALKDLINEQSRRLQEDIAERSGDVTSADGRVSVHQGTGLLIASGGKTFVELVGTLMDAYVKDSLMQDALKAVAAEKDQVLRQADPKVAKP